MIPSQKTHTLGIFDPTLPEDSGTRSPDNSTNSIDPATEVAGTLCMQYAARNIVELDTTLALPFPGILHYQELSREPT